MTEVTTETQISKFDRLKQEATKKIADMTHDEIAGYIALLKVNMDESSNSYREANRVLRDRLQSTVDTVTDFIKDNLESGADVDDLKELAKELDIELTKTLKVEMTIKYYADLTVPLDYDNESLGESDFSIIVRFDSNEDDVDIDNESTEVNDFEVEEA